MKKRLLTLLVAGSSIGFGLLAAPAMAVEQPGQCTQSHSFEHITGSLVVPTNATCRLYNTQVDGTISVRPGGSLIVQSGSASGSPSVIGGTVSDDHGYVNISNSTVKGQLSLNAPQNGIQQEGVGGGHICNSSVASVNIQNAPNGYSIGGGSCEEYGTTGSAYGNHVGGSVNVANNPSLITIEGNTIGGNLNCIGNNPAPEFYGNTVAGRQIGQCQQQTVSG